MDRLIINIWIKCKNIQIWFFKPDSSRLYRATSDPNLGRKDGTMKSEAGDIKAQYAAQVNRVTEWLSDGVIGSL